MAKHLRTLLVEDNRIEARQIQHWLKTSQDAVFDVEWVLRLDAGHQHLVQGDIDLVLLDLNLPDSSGLDTFENLYRAFPDVPIVVLTGESDHEIGLAAVQKGAQDYLVKQRIEASELTRALFYAALRHRAHVNVVPDRTDAHTACTYGFIGAKGGVGNTTVAINVAAALAKQGKAVILAELRPSFGTVAFNLHFGLGDGQARSLRSLLNLSPDRIEEAEVSAVLRRGPAGMRILIGLQPGENYEELDPVQVGRLLQVLRLMTEYLVLDLPNQPTAATQAAVDLCDFVGVVAEREAGAIHHGKLMVQQLESWGIGGSLLGAILVVRAVLPVWIETAEIQSDLGCKIACVIPEASAACAKARVDGVPLVLSQPENVAAEALTELAGNLLSERVIGIPV